MSIRTVLFGLIVAFLLSGCIAGNRMASDGNYYKNVGAHSCERYNVVTPGKIKCFDGDGRFTRYQYAMTDQEVMIWKLDDMQRQINSNKSRANRNANCQKWYYDC